MAVTAGLKVRIDEIIGAIARTRLMLLGLIASFVLVPLVTVLLLHVFSNTKPAYLAGFCVFLFSTDLGGGLRRPS
jgi:ACR3 family arsenite efflux pump ArsB